MRTARGGNRLEHKTDDTGTGGEGTAGQLVTGDTKREQVRQRGQGEGGKKKVGQEGGTQMGSGAETRMGGSAETKWGEGGENQVSEEGGTQEEATAGIR